jgi:DNA-directed RNA polymerase subunit RPC12/RpoP
LSNPHQMTRTKTLEQGTEEWSCTECSRRLLIRRPPAYEKVVLERGDEWAAHTGSTGGLQVSATTTQPSHTGTLPVHDRGWLAANGIEWGSDDMP